VASPGDGGDKRKMIKSAIYFLLHAFANAIRFTHHTSILAKGFLFLSGRSKKKIVKSAEI
jgi:hypothetical protein